MASCSGIKADGQRCYGTAMEGYDHCYGHREDLAEERRRNASKGGRRGGRGRPGSDLAGVKTDIRAVIADVLAGEVQTGPAAVALQGYNALIRAEKLELDIREQHELTERLEELEALLEQRAEGSRYGA
jgi:hypothetical protein